MRIEIAIFRHKEPIFLVLVFRTMRKTSLLLLQLVAAQGNTQLRRPLAGTEGDSESFSQNFLLDGLELNFFADEVDGDFCDASSPLSLAGYMNGEFLYTASLMLFIVQKY